MENIKTVFISIASYRDPELIPTLLDLINMAGKADNLHITVCWQHDENVDESLFLKAGMLLQEEKKIKGHDLFIFDYSGAQISVISVHYTLSQGACWARALSETCFNNESYFLQIDSHCRFIKNWDAEMIAMLEDLRKLSPKPVLSTYPPGYQPDNESDRKTYISRLVFREFTDGGIVMLTSTPVKQDLPSPCCYLAGGFIFADGSFAKEVPNDPEIFFAGEEIAMAVRAFTHNYDAYTPNKILLWHYYGRSKERKIWSDHTKEAQTSGIVDLVWWERDKISKQRVRSLLGIETPPFDLGPYTAGSIRTLHDFELAAGICFKHGTVQPEVVEGERLNWFPPEKRTLPDWSERLVKPNRKIIKVSAKELDVTRDDVDWWHIGVYDDRNTLLGKKVLTSAQITALSKDKSPEDVEDIEVLFEFNTEKNVKPNTIRICPFLTNQGWGNVTEKTW